MPDFRPSLEAAEREEMLRLRRDFHRHPELAFQEERTSAVVADRLSAMGLDPATGIAETGLAAVIEGGHEGPTLMLRSDMDALPVNEVEGRPYGSEIDGVMHACGHDGHMATLLAAASVLQRERATLAGRVKVVFQPAEEGMGGARHMIADGVLENPHVDAAIGLHYWSQSETGKIGVSPGPVMASVDEFTIHVKGRGGHAAMPHEAADPIVAAAAVVGALQTIPSRRNDPRHAAALSVTTFRSGTAFNIIPDEALLGGTVRCFDRDIWTAVPGQMEEILGGICRAHGCHFELDYRRINIPLVNDPKMAALVREVATELVGEANVEDFSTLGGEDMACYLDAVPGCFFVVGAASAAKGIGAPHHSPGFDLDEDALSIGAEMLVRIARRYLSAR